MPEWRTSIRCPLPSGLRETSKAHRQIFRIGPAPDRSADPSNQLARSEWRNKISRWGSRLNPIIAKWLLNRHRVTEVFLPLFHQTLDFLEYVIRSAKKKVLVVTPMWPSAPWWPQLMSMVAGFPSVLVKDSRTLIIDNDEEKQRSKRFHMRQELVAWKISGSKRVIRHGQEQISKLSLSAPEVKKRIVSMSFHGLDGSSSVVNTNRTIFQTLSGIFQSISMCNPMKNWIEEIRNILHMTVHISSVEILCTTILPSKFWFHHTIGSRDTTI